MGPRNKAVEALIESIKIDPTTPFVVAPRVSQLAELPSALDYELYETKVSAYVCMYMCMCVCVCAGTICFIQCSHTST
jgi:hypothetical protein